MNLWAAASESATSGWFEGWIGGLIAAAVTLGFTAWWETRQHRRRQLDDALLELSDAQNQFWQAVQRMPARGWDEMELAVVTNRVGIAQLRAGALSARRVLGIPARFVAPARDGLRKTLSALDGVWVTELKLVIGKKWPKVKTEEEYDRVLEELAPVMRAAAAQMATCHGWLHNPWRFAWSRNLSDRMQSSIELDTSLS
ncbi:hypothetical protein [Cellulosimicrobium sp. JZ28]|uniref:hypothetical protein n=1 Tax=Cellulosimicrobium sp. JZ28 TaxID=1906273 RepID=UPI00188A314E|nr:hypothetical protein [Cellulosimicrobium sp. JZ28]